MIAYINKGIRGWMVMQHLASVLRWHVSTAWKDMALAQARGRPGFLSPRPTGTFLFSEREVRYRRYSDEASAHTTWHVRTPPWMFLAVVVREHSVKGVRVHDLCFGYKLFIKTGRSRKLKELRRCLARHQKNKTLIYSFHYSCHDQNILRAWKHNVIIVYLPVWVYVHTWGLNVSRMTAGRKINVLCTVETHH